MICRISITLEKQLLLYSKDIFVSELEMFPNIAKCVYFNVMHLLASRFSGYFTEIQLKTALFHM